MKKNDFVLPILIILLAFFIPATIYGVNRHNSSILDKDNPDHLTKKDGKLYFYENNELLGVYECQTPATCEIASTSIEDRDNLYYEGSPNKLPIYRSNYVFIQDGGQVYYYWIEKNMSILKLNSVKDYGIGISGGLLILQNEYSQYGLFDPETGTFLIEPIYEYMALTGQELNEEKISIEKIIVKRDNEYYLMDETENILTAKIADSIYAFDDNAIYSKTDLGNYNVLDYQGNKILSEEFKKITYLENSNVLITTDNMVRIYSKDFLNMYYDKRYDSSDLSFEEKDNVVSIIDNEKVTIDSVELKEQPEEASEDEEETPNEDEE